MHRLLIPLLACFFLSMPALLRAQVPHEIQYAPFDPQKVKVTINSPDMPCGNAGTYTFGQFNGSSNDLAPPPIFLCFGDSLLVQHMGDADLTGDPISGTPAGIAYAFYDCPPTIMGPTLQDVGEIPGPGDPCVLSGSMNGLYITQAVPNGGGTWFFNSGALQTTFNMGQPLSLFFAPITVDDFAGNNYESAQVGFPPGPCVAVNTAIAFEVVYLNAITATGISNNFGNDCLGRFTIRGGYPQYDNNAVYTISISLAGNPSVKAIVHTSASNLFHLSSVAFSVPIAGVYDVVVEDGKSCPFSFKIDMNVCNPVDNVMLNFPDSVVAPGGQICIPVTVENFAIVSGSFSIEWDETVLQYNSLQNVSSVIDAVFGPANLNEQQTSNGLLGVQIFNNLNPTTIYIDDDSTLFEICFTAIGSLGDCSGLIVTNNPTGVALEDSIGQNLALSVDTGQVCIAFLPLEFTYAVIDANCLGQATLTITPSGGVAPYEITVIETTPTGQGPTYNTINMTIIETNGVFEVQSPVGSTNNTPYSYNICVQDNNGQGALQCTTLIVDIKRLGAQINFAQQPLCNGEATGIISAVVLNGGVVVPNPGTNYTYDWAPAINIPTPGSQVQNGVIAGSYTVTVTDLNTGCFEVASGSLGQPPKISSQSVVNNPASCSGVCDGTITYDAEGGTPFAGPAYQYTWTYETTNTTLGNGTDNPILLGNACAGEYSLLITDANGCTFTENNLILTDLRSLSITQNALQNVPCNGDSTGSISITVVESVVTGNNFTFTWMPAGFNPTGTSPSSTYSGLPVGAYSVTASDNLGCKISFDTIITQPPLLTVDSLGQTNPGCDQPNTGSVSVVVLGGTGFGTYSYMWNVAGTADVLSGLPFGTYTVTVTDANGCTATRQFNIPVPAPPDVTITSTPIKCGSDGSLTATSATGVIFIWTDINAVLIESTATIDSLQGGDYIVKVIDVVGCITIDTITLTGVIPMSFSDTTLKEPTCFGLADGRIAIGVQDGQPPYVGYMWTPTQTPSGPVIFGLIAGTYTVTVTDNVGCTLVGTFVLGEPSAIVNTFDPAVIGRVSCFGICDGAASPLTAYSDGPGDFDFLWEDGITDSMRINLCAGFNYVTITDKDKCYIIDSVEITTPPEITFSSLIITETNCFGDSTGAATITATGGNGGPYMYLWNTFDTINSITGLPAGVYTVTLTDVNSCSNSIDTINIGQPDQIVLSTTFTNPFCFGGNNGQTTVEVVGGVPAYTYVWQDTSGTTVDIARIAEMLTAGTYFVTVTDMNGCTAVTNATVTDPPPVVGDFENIAPLTCFGDEAILNILSIGGGSGGPYSFSVDFGAVLDPTFPVSIGGGQHYISFIDKNGCIITDSLFVVEPAQIMVIFNPDVLEVELGDSIALNPIITAQRPIESFMWTNPEFLLNPNSLDAKAYTFSNLTYTLTVQDSFGCSGSGSVLVNVDPNRNVYIPNIFKPANPTGLNDHFNVNVGLGVEIVNFMHVYDRWGELLYQREKFMPNNDNFSEGWDGRFNGDFVNPGVFVYISEVRFLDGRVLLYRGDVTVVR